MNGFEGCSLNRATLNLYTQLQISAIRSNANIVCICNIRPFQEAFPFHLCDIITNNNTGLLTIERLYYTIPPVCVCKYICVCGVNIEYTGRYETLDKMSQTRSAQTDGTIEQGLERAR